MAFYCTKTSDFWLDFVSITWRTNINLILFCTLGDLHLIHHRGSLIWWPSSGDRTTQHFFKVLVGIRISRTIAKPIINHYLEGHFTAVWRYIDQNMAKTHRKACLSILIRPKSNSTPRKNPFNNYSFNLIKKSTYYFLGVVHFRTRDRQLHKVVRSWPNEINKFSSLICNFIIYRNNDPCISTLNHLKLNRSHTHCFRLNYCIWTWVFITAYHDRRSKLIFIYFMPFLKF